jgi:hypothetical protein
LLGALGSAIDLGVCGVFVNYLSGLGWDTIKAYRAVFWAYSALGGIVLCFILGLGKTVRLRRLLSP